MYKLKNLPYDFDALEPYIDTHTLGLHHLKHQQNYLNKLNELLTKENYDFRYSLEQLTQHLEEFKESNYEDILFNLGGVINHNIYFMSMSPNKVMPSKALLNKINSKYESFDNFKKEFEKMALSIKESGYTYLVFDGQNIEIINLLNQDNPYNHNLIPLLCIDMWEHAYYLNYENKKDYYIDNFLEVMDFALANKFFNFS